MKWGDWAELSASERIARPAARHSRAARVARDISEYVLVFAVLFIIFSLVGVGSVFGAEGTVTQTLPTARIYPAPGGILFPGINVAPGVNAAALPLEGKGTAVQAAVTPPLESGDATGFFGGIATSNQKFGAGVGYTGAKPSNGSMVHGLFGGLGVALKPVTLGVQLRDPDLKNGSVGLDAGLVVGQGHGLELGGVLYDLNHSTRADLAIGYGDKNYNLEANVLLPPFSNFDSDYVLTAAATIYAGIFGVYFRTSYFTRPSDWSHTFGGLAWVTKKVNVLVQFTTTRTLTAGLTVLL